MEKNNQTQSERRTRRRTVEQVQRDLLKDLVAHVNRSGNLKTIHKRHANLNVFMPSWAKRDGNSPLQSKAPMTQQDSRASPVVVDWGEEIKDQQNDNHGAERDVYRERMRQVLKELLDEQKKVHCERERNLMELQKEKERREIVMKELLTFHAQQQIKKNKQQIIGVFEELMTFHIQQKIRKNKERMLRVFQELMTFHVKQKIQKSKRQMREVFSELMPFHEQRMTEKNTEQMRTVFSELMTFHAQQKIRKSKELKAGVFAELMTFHALQRTKQITERMSDIFAELMTFHAQRKTQKSKERMMLVFAELLQTNSKRKQFKLFEEEEEACEEFVPRKLFLFNISTFKSSDDHLLQGPSYPDLSSPVASAELAPPSDSLDGAQAVVGDENKDEEEDKMETPSRREKKKYGLRRRIRRFLGLK